LVSYSRGREGWWLGWLGAQPARAAARRGCQQWRRRQCGWAAGSGSACGAKGKLRLIATCDPPSDQGMDGGCLGARARRTTGQGPLVCAVYGSVRKVRCARTSRAPRCACALGKQRCVGRKSRRARGAACARERVRGQILFGVPLFKRVKLQKVE
jgi:hypothetical protein